MPATFATKLETSSKLATCAKALGAFVITISVFEFALYP
jgi:hypothetical protein